jgi:hypothetical protein
VLAGDPLEEEKNYLLVALQVAAAQTVPMRVADSA